MRRASCSPASSASTAATTRLAGGKRRKMPSSRSSCRGLGAPPVLRKRVRAACSGWSWKWRFAVRGPPGAPREACPAFTEGPPRRSGDTVKAEGPPPKGGCVARRDRGRSARNVHRDPGLRRQKEEAARTIGKKAEEPPCAGRRERGRQGLARDAGDDGTATQASERQPRLDESRIRGPPETRGPIGHHGIARRRDGTMRSCGTLQAEFHADARAWGWADGSMDSLSSTSATCSSAARSRVTTSERQSWSSASHWPVFERSSTLTAWSSFS